MVLDLWNRSLAFLTNTIRTDSARKPAPVPDVWATASADRAIEYCGRFARIFTPQLG